MIIIIFFENMVIDAFLACLFNFHYLIFLSMVHEYAYFLRIYLEIGLQEDRGAVTAIDENCSTTHAQEFITCRQKIGLLAMPALVFKC